MAITWALARLVRQGYAAWLHDRGTQASADAARQFAHVMTDGDRRDYEGLSMSEVEKVLLEDS